MNHPNPSPAETVNLDCLVSIGIGIRVTTQWLDKLRTANCQERQMFARKAFDELGARVRQLLALASMPGIDPEFAKALKEGISSLAVLREEARQLLKP